MFSVARRLCLPVALAGQRQGGVRSNTNQRLTKIAALQHGAKCLWRLRKSGPQVLFVFHFALADPVSHLGQKVGLVLVDKVPHMQTVYLDVLALEGGRALGHPGVVRVALRGAAILRDESTETDARLPIAAAQP